MTKRLRHVRNVGIVVLVVLAIALGFQTVQRHSVNQDIQAASERAVFWEAITYGSATGTSPDMQLARDLHPLVGETDPSATMLPVEVATFKGNPNRYAGVQDDLGFAPFDDSATSCRNCGPLSRDMKDNLLLIKQGNLNAVLDSERPAPPAPYRITPPGVPAYAGVLLLVGAMGGYLLVPHVLHQQRVRRDEKAARGLYGNYLDELDAIEHALRDSRPNSVHDERAIGTIRTQIATERTRILQAARAGGDAQNVSPALSEVHERIQSLSDSFNINQAVLRELRGTS